MIVSDFTRDALRLRRSRRGLTAEGFEQVGENGGRLWELYRGFRQDHVIVEARVDLDGKSLWIKTARCTFNAYKREDEMANELDTTNTFMVSVSGANIVMLRPPRGSMSKSDALNLAAWIVALVDHDNKFPALLEAIQET